MRTILSVHTSFYFTYKVLFKHLWIHFHTQNSFHTLVDLFQSICGSRYICDFLFTHLWNFCPICPAQICKFNSSLIATLAGYSLMHWSRSGRRPGHQDTTCHLIRSMLRDWWACHSHYWDIMSWWKSYKLDQPVIDFFTLIFSSSFYIE